jgi:hypothetical protein
MLVMKDLTDKSGGISMKKYPLFYQGFQETTIVGKILSRPILPFGDDGPD